MKVKLQNPPLPIGSEVRVYNQANAMDKVKPKLLPGYWKVIGKGAGGTAFGLPPSSDSAKGGLYVLQQGKNIIKVNRWMIKAD